MSGNFENAELLPARRYSPSAARVSIEGVKVGPMQYLEFVYEHWILTSWFLMLVTGAAAKFFGAWVYFWKAVVNEKKVQS